jgi:hypothetical protein
LAAQLTLNQPIVTTFTDNLERQLIKLPKQTLQKEKQKKIATVKKYSLPNDVMAIMLPSMYEKIYTSSDLGSTCSNSHTYVCINYDSVVTEFSNNYYKPDS